MNIQYNIQQKNRKHITESIVCNIFYRMLLTFFFSLYLLAFFFFFSLFCCYSQYYFKTFCITLTDRTILLLLLLLLIHHTMSGVRVGGRGGGVYDNYRPDRPHIPHQIRQYHSQTRLIIEYVHYTSIY